jgi:hypothetical protein
MEMMIGASKDSCASKDNCCAMPVRPPHTISPRATMVFATTTFMDLEKHIQEWASRRIHLAGRVTPCAPFWYADEKRAGDCPPYPRI